MSISVLEILFVQVFSGKRQQSLFTFHSFCIILVNSFLEELSNLCQSAICINMKVNKLSQKISNSRKETFRISCRFSVLANFFSVIAQILFVIAQQSLKNFFVIVVLGNQHPKKIDCWVKASWLFLCRVLPAKPEPPQWPPNGVR